MGLANEYGAGELLELLGRLSAMLTRLAGR
jgi:hypothetical protein